MPDDRQSTEESGSRTFVLTVAYNGAPFCGFARQPGQLTVQGEIEHALFLLFRREVETTCAGRTDAGVHARAQVVSFDVDATELEGRTMHALCRSLNALTHEQIVVREVASRTVGFSARFDALAREYRYFICVDKTPPVFMREFCWHVPASLDVAAMERGAAHLVGEHDFKSFCLASSADDGSTCRNVSAVDFSHEEIMGERMLVCTIVGNAFLHSMVRAIIGTLIAVGKGRREPGWVHSVLEARDRKAAGENAPASGLVLWEVYYGSGSEEKRA